MIEGYAADERGNPRLAGEGLHASMSAPVWRNGVVCGALTVASRSPGRQYGDDEREVLVAFAEHASLALTDARNHSDAVHRALHDPLTNLPNRTLFLDRLHQAEQPAARSGGCTAVLFLDLDGFKTVNDSLGHGAGDELLVAVATRLASVLRAGDSAARLGGDERDPRRGLGSGAGGDHRRRARAGRPARAVRDQRPGRPRARASGSPPRAARAATWVLEAACRQATEWHGIPVTVNVSSVQLRSTDFPATVAATLATTGLPADRLILEITESVLVQDVERTAEQLRELKQLGVRIAIDDFRVIAEGIEVDAQRTRLIGLGCRAGQGFLFSRPLDPQAFAQLLARPAGIA